MMFLHIVPLCLGCGGFGGPGGGGGDGDEGEDGEEQGEPPETPFDETIEDLLKKISELEDLLEFILSMSEEEYKAWIKSNKSLLDKILEPISALVGLAVIGAVGYQVLIQYGILAGAEATAAAEMLAEEGAIAYIMSHRGLAAMLPFIGGGLPWETGEFSYRQTDMRSVMRDIAKMREELEYWQKARERHLESYDPKSFRMAYMKPVNWIVRLGDDIAKAGRGLRDFEQDLIRQGFSQTEVNKQVTQLRAEFKEYFGKQYNQIVQEFVRVGGKYSPIWQVSGSEAAAHAEGLILHYVSNIEDWI